MVVVLLLLVEVAVAVIATPATEVLLAGALEELPVTAVKLATKCAVA